ncbi:MAG: M1 family metallopeptidase [Clostridiales bacterium]|nr:M1 family metallopeptidase [Clostridiales bacterium]
MKKLVALVFALFTLIFISGCGVGGDDLSKISKTIPTYNMDIVYNDEEKKLEVNQVLDYINTYDTSLDEIYLHLYPKSFNLDAVNKPVGVLTKEKAYYNGDSEGDILIADVKCDAEVEAITYTGDDEDFLKIELTSAVAPGERLQVEFDYEVVIPNCNHRFGYGENTINLGNFYPVLAVFEDGQYSLNPYHSNGDPFYSEVANYNVTITAPEKYIIASTGSMTDSSVVDGVQTVSYEAKVCRDYAFVMSEKYSVASTTIEGVEVMYYYYEDDNYEKHLQASVDALVTFNELFGRYPYSTLSVAKTNFVHGGMEYPNLVYISDDDMADADYINVIVHEIAHQWWYGVVGNDEYVNSWLDEGLTEFSTNLFYENNPSYGVNADDVVKNLTKNYATFVDVYSTILGEVDTSMNRALDEYDTEPEYVYVTYVKGNLFFNSLREMIGKDKFMQGLKEYYNEYKYLVATPEGMMGVFEGVTGTDLSQFFSSWIEGKIDIIEIK